MAGNTSALWSQPCIGGVFPSDVLPYNVRKSPEQNV